MYSNRTIFWKFHLDITEFHKRNADKQLLFDYNKKLQFCNKVFGIFIIITVIICSVYPIFDSVFLTKKKVLCFGVLLIFTNPNGIIGYICNFLFQNIQAVIVGYGYVVFLRIYWLLFAQACARIDLLKISVNDLKEHITDSDNENQNQIVSIKLNDIAQLHLEYLRFKSVVFGGASK